MIVSHPKRLGALVLAAAFAAAACSGSGSRPHRVAPPDRRRASTSMAAVEGTVTVDGSSTVYPDHRGRRRGVPGGPAGRPRDRRRVRHRRRVQEVLRRRDRHQRRLAADQGRRRGRGQGLRRPTASTWVELQVAIDGLTVVVNPENTWVTCLTLEQLDDHLRPGLARGPELEGRRPELARPSRSSATCRAPTPGTFDYFTEAVNGEADVSTSFATQSEDDNVLVTGVAGDVNAHQLLRLRVLRREHGQAQGGRDRRRQRLRRPDRRDDRRQQLRAAEPAAVHLPEHGDRGRRPGPQGLRRLLPGQRRHPRGRGRLRRGPGRRGHGQQVGRLDGRRTASDSSSSDATPRPTRTARGVAFVHGPCARLTDDR